MLHSFEDENREAAGAAAVAMLRYMLGVMAIAYDDMERHAAAIVHDYDTGSSTHREHPVPWQKGDAPVS